MLNPGTKLGPYEIQAQIGAGGMGEVEALWRRLSRQRGVCVPRSFAGPKSRAPAWPGLTPRGISHAQS